MNVEAHIQWLRSMVKELRATGTKSWTTDAPRTLSFTLEDIADELSILNRLRDVNDRSTG